MNTGPGKKLLFAALFIVGVVGWIYLVQEDRQVFGAVATGVETVNWFLASIGYISTVIGVVFGALFRALQEKEKLGEREIANVKEFLKKVARSTDLWAGLAASPIVCGLIFKVTNGIALSGMVVIALQNGFFCHAIIERIKKNPAS